MKYAHIFKSLVIISTLIASSTYAVIIEANFWGIAQPPQGIDSYPGLQGLPMDNYDVVAKGSKVYGSFSYDTDKAPPYANGGFVGVATN
ncbi:MAG: hypothetical protein V4660_06015 [Pseudomonadota bacterium]